MPETLSIASPSIVAESALVPRNTARVAISILLTVLDSWAVDEVRQAVVAYATFNATHTGEGGPSPPTGKSMSTDYVYVMQFAGDKIAHMTKIWNSGLALKAIGWA